MVRTFTTRARSIASCFYISFARYVHFCLSAARAPGSQPPSCAFARAYARCTRWIYCVLRFAALRSARACCVRALRAALPLPFALSRACAAAASAIKQQKTLLRRWVLKRAHNATRLLPWYALRAARRFALPSTIPIYLVCGLRSRSGSAFRAAGFAGFAIVQRVQRRRRRFRHGGITIRTSGQVCWLRGATDGAINMASSGVKRFFANAAYLSCAGVWRQQRI